MSISDADSAIHPVKFAPSPWTTKAECYWLFLTLSSLPEGIYDPLEASSEECAGKEAGDFKGGLGCIMIVRYSDTPVGPYDELMLIPGNFTVPQPGSPIPEIPKKALRIARIYVSQRDTVYNGRINWNIPKHLARFEFSHPPTPKGVAPPSQLDVRVFPASTTDVDEIDPFFSCSLKPWKWIPSVPVSTRYLPLSTAMAQPPVPAAAGFHEAAKEEGEGRSSWKNEYRGGDPRYCIKPEYEKVLLAGTDRWCYMPIHSYAPRARGCWVSVHTPKRDVHSANEPDKHWPQDIVPWSVGAWMEDAEMIIDKPVQWKL